MSFYEMLQLLIANHGALIGNVIPMDQDGMRVYPLQGASHIVLAQTIAPDLQTHDWIITSTHQGNVLIEPRYTRQVLWPETSFCYHVSDLAKRDAILQSGLELKEGGNTTMNRTYPPRIHVARNLLAAVGFVKFQCKYANMPPELLAQKEIVPKHRDQLDIWRVELPDCVIKYADILFPNEAAYIEQPVAKENLMLVSWWSEFGQLWDVERKLGMR